MFFDEPYCSLFQLRFACAALQMSCTALQASPYDLVCCCKPRREILIFSANFSCQAPFDLGAACETWRTKLAASFCGPL